MVNPEAKPSSIGQIMGIAVAEQVRRVTYCLIVDTGDTEVGTAVAIQLGERFFLATAAHVVDNVHGVKALVRGQVAHYVSNFVARHCNKDFNVGLLEVSSSDSHLFDFLSRDRLCETIEAEHHLPAMVVGFPAQFCKPSKKIDLTSESSLQVVHCDTLTFHTVVLPRSEWPSDGLPDDHGRCRQLVDGHDMLIDYTPEPEVKPFPGKTGGIENPPVECLSLDPHGMSGGGIWLAQVAEGKERLNYPDARLIGLQIGWHRARHLLRGIRIRNWLDLVRSRYPGLR